MSTLEVLILSSNYQARRKIQAGQTERAILAAATELSRERSFEKISVREICQHAGITTGAFYHHFKSKSELLQKGFTSLDLYMEDVLHGHENDEPTQRLRLILSAYADFMENLGFELVSRYYSQRLDCPTFQSITPNRFIFQSLFSCIQEVCSGRDPLPGYTPKWVSDFLFRHFRGVVIDWIINRGTYSLSDKLQQDYVLFQKIFQP